MTGHDAFTRWDLLPVAYPGLHEGVRGRSAADCLLRCVARIEPYELASRAIRDRGQNDPAVTRLLSGLNGDYRARCRTWAAEVGPGPDVPGPGFAFALALLGVVGPLTLAAFIAADPRMTPLRGWPVFLMTAPLVVPLSFVAALGTVRLAVPSLTPAQALAQRRCPDCAWRLAEIPPAIDPKAIGGVNTGPAACPRCKRPWPLVPPPADAALSSAGA
jgi:hypothetical protein